MVVPAEKRKVSLTVPVTLPYGQEIVIDPGEVRVAATVDWLQPAAVAAAGERPLTSLIVTPVAVGRVVLTAVCVAVAPPFDSFVNFVTEIASAPAVMKCGATSSVTQDAGMSRPVLGSTAEGLRQMFGLAARPPGANAS